MTSFGSKLYTLITLRGFNDLDRKLWLYIALTTGSMPAKLLQLIKSSQSYSHVKFRHKITLVSFAARVFARKRGNTLNANNSKRI